MENELYHHGVLGMRWGRRSGRVSASVSKNKSNEEENKKISSMTDEELRSRVNRLNLEKQYKEALASQNNRSRSRAKELVARIANKSVEDIGTQATSFALGTMVNELAGKKVVDPTKMQKNKK